MKIIQDDEASADGASSLMIDARGGRGQRLDQFLARYLQDQIEGVSRTRIQRWIALGAVHVDQQVRLPSLRLKGVEHVEVVPQPLESDTAFAPDPVPLQVLYQDADISIINKPAGLVTHPAPGNWRYTLMNGLLYADPRAARLPRAGIVHRLDRDTSGLLVCARSERAFASLTGQLASREMGRRYLALATGLTAEQGTIEGNIGRDPQHRLRMAVLAAPAGKPARTHFQRLAINPEQTVSALLCRLETGRTHQIRVHLASTGHPLLGDALYGGRAVGDFSRQALHAWQLSLIHPASGERHTFVAPLPDDLCTLARQLQLPLAEHPPA
ncbi:MAG: RluA family pseudouridine synthase [Lautropia sp.]|nr:RluA family pseudouridine synthase [Lautropia sp.]